MGALQPGLPSPTVIPDNTYKIILDLKDCFYTIPLALQDCQRFAFSVPSINFKEPMERYQWRVLPQGRPYIMSKICGSSHTKNQDSVSTILYYSLYG